MDRGKLTDLADASRRARHRYEFEAMRNTATMSDDELIERVAREICLADGLNPDDCTHGVSSSSPSGSTYECLRLRWMEHRRRAARIVDQLSKELPAIVLDAQLRALERWRLDTPDELNSAKWIATTKAAKEQAND